MSPIPILYQDDEIYLINKPAGISVQGGAGVSHPLDAVLAAQLGKKVYPVHRLDKETAGLLVVARTHEAAGIWAVRMSGKSAAVRKTYAAFCIGDALAPVGSITAAVAGRHGPQPAVTHYRVTTRASCLFGEERIPVMRLSLVLGTGRTHQIRIHLAQCGCPVVGDDKYGAFRINRALRKNAGVKQLMLAAVELTLPLSGKLRTFSIPLPAHMAAFGEHLC
ncbi:MAG: RluA family pseudouridine synthase [Treponema sp.]|nr:RluA family pseudouridine synthase [Treponema sp.]